MEEGILKQLERTRELMIRSGIENGLRNAKTIRLSRQLDRLMNKYAKQQKQNENRIDNQLMN
ncbi:aspartyl-phosphate phosphatase Spo0E family protein [Metasolibacillus meyeri]|uniref:Aspartyl-phosphate phosphatase Spo0E family protein n=1 Tax=Metasolibacillus meyeri TaxID=1071052 RepID=A0AAW9NQE4_9BACL|nr:aspartyl-phosphate phosphatase Spo0E family protein [Metasolibacillus meyeri]MEC1178716.1 aspartyl-phosphate phosphatase Spo0E family protein [Metasolibacillus meyeri]